MSEQAEKGGVSILDTLKLVLAVAALIGGIAGYYLLGNLAPVLRVLLVLAGLALSFALLLWSAPGKVLWQFVQGSRVELRKMVWSTRQETLQTTLVVFVFVLALGIFFWLVDLGLAWGTRSLTGQGG
jgi:preprotein translocase subunit SecE